MKKETRWIVGFIAANIAFVAVWGNPADYFFEAGDSAYYQARVGYEHGTAQQKADIAESFADQKITLREYSEKVWPAFLATVPDGGDNLYPEAAKKSVEELRSDLARTIQYGYGEKHGYKGS